MRWGLEYLGHIWDQTKKIVFFFSFFFFFWVEKGKKQSFSSLNYYNFDYFEHERPRFGYGCGVELDSRKGFGG